MKQVIARRSLFPPLALASFFLVLTLLSLMTLVNGYDPKNSIYYPLFGRSLIPLFLACITAADIGLVRLCLISHEFIRTDDDKLYIGLRKPITREEIEDFNVEERGNSELLILNLKDSQTIQTSLSKLVEKRDIVLNRLSDWLHT